MQQRERYFAGKERLLASRTIQEESLPIEYSMTGLANSAATSRMI
jgi:hypothetical protein